MTVIARIVHPSPVLYVPRRARTQSLGYLRLETSVEIPEADPAEFTRLPYRTTKAGRPPILAEHGRELHERGGRLWHPLRDLRLPGRGSRRMAREDFVAALGRGLSDTWENLPGQGSGMRRADDLVFHFLGTPLLPSRYPAATADVARPYTGLHAAGDMQGARVVEDMSGAAEAGLREFVSREVALVGDDVFVRVQGPMAVRSAWEGPDFRLTLFPRAHAVEACRPDEFDAFADFVHRNRPGTCSSVRRGILLDRDAADGVPAELMEDDDIRTSVARLTESLHFEFRTRGHVLGDDPEFVSLQGRMRTAAALSPMGVMASGTVEDQMAECVRALNYANGRPDVFGGSFARQEDYVRSIAMPRLRRHEPVDEADAEALAGVAPGY